MSARGQRLLEESIQQIDMLANSLARAGAVALARPCPGRGKLGDGTVGAVATHTADNYHHVARFLRPTPGAEASHRGRAHGTGHRVEDVDLGNLLDRLVAAKLALAVLAELDDRALGTTPTAGDMKFVDGVRTLEQILVNVLKHQRHQVDALAAALA
jgi:hypothetical protein